MRSAPPHSRAPRLLPALALVVAGALAPTTHASAQQGYYRPPPEQYYRGHRTRFGAEGELGGMAGWQGALGGGVTVAAGLQLNDIIAAYAQHRLFLASPVDGSSGGSHATSYNSFIFELTLFELVQIGAGPSVDFGVGSLCPALPDATTGVMTSQSSCSGVTGPYAGLDVRLGLALSERSSARRRGLTVSLHGHTTWISRETDQAFTITLAVGYILH